MAGRLPRPRASLRQSDGRILGERRRSETLVMWYPLGRMERARVGDRVRFKFGGRTVTGEVIEDRGPIASQGGQLVRVMLETADPDDAKDVEVAARDVEALEKNTKRANRGTPRLAPSH